MKIIETYIVAIEIQSFGKTELIFNKIHKCISSLNFRYFKENMQGKLEPISEASFINAYELCQEKLKNETV